MLRINLMRELAPRRPERPTFHALAAFLLDYSDKRRGEQRIKARAETRIGMAYDRANAGPDCARTLALYRRGERIAGVKCRPHYSGKVPCTGPILCMLCGAER